MLGQLLGYTEELYRSIPALVAVADRDAGDCRPACSRSSAASRPPASSSCSRASAPLFVLAPLFSSRQIPPRVRTIVACALAIGLTPIAMHGQQIPNDVLALFGLVLEGAARRARVRALARAAVRGGLERRRAARHARRLLLRRDRRPAHRQPVGRPRRSSTGSSRSRSSSRSTGRAGSIGGLARTFELVPLTAAPDISSLGAGVVETFTTIFASALQVAAPVLLAVVITDVAFGVVTRVVPQLNVFAVGFPVKVVVGMLVVARLAAVRVRLDLRPAAAERRAGAPDDQARVGPRSWRTTRPRRATPKRREEARKKRPGREVGGPQRRGRADRRPARDLAARAAHRRAPPRTRCAPGSRTSRTRRR